MPTAYPNNRTKGVTFGAAAVTMNLSGRGKRVMVSATEGCYIDFYRDAVQEESLFLPADTPTTIDVLYPNMISVIQETGAGILTIMEEGDVVMFDRIRGWFTSNASLLGIGSTTYSGDASLKRIVPASATGNSNILKTLSDSANADSSLLATVSGSATGDADLVSA